MVASLLFRRLMPEHHYIPLMTVMSLPHILWLWRVELGTIGQGAAWAGNASARKTLGNVQPFDAYTKREPRAPS